MTIALKFTHIPVTASDDLRRQADAIVALFVESFTQAEGADEGAFIEDLVRQFINEADVQDVHVFLAWDKTALVGGCILSPLEFSQDSRRVYLLSPVAVASETQGQGVGQALLRHAFQSLRAQGADAVVTYGDPAFYGKVGFMPVSVETVPAPHPLSQPEGWLAQSLTDEALTPFIGPVRCAKPLDDPAFW